MAAGLWANIVLKVRQPWRPVRLTPPFVTSSGGQGCSPFNQLPRHMRQPRRERAGGLVRHARCLTACWACSCSSWRPPPGSRTSWCVRWRGSGRSSCSALSCSRWRCCTASRCGWGSEGSSRASVDDRRPVAAERQAPACCFVLWRTHPRPRLASATVRLSCRRQHNPEIIMNNHSLQARFVGSPAAEVGLDSGAQDHRPLANAPVKPSRDQGTSVQAVAGQVPRRGPSGSTHPRTADHAWGRWCW